MSETVKNLCSQYDLQGAFQIECHSLIGNRQLLSVLLLINNACVFGFLALQMLHNHPEITIRIILRNYPSMMIFLYLKDP